MHIAADALKRLMTGIFAATGRGPAAARSA